MKEPKKKRLRRWFQELLRRRFYVVVLIVLQLALLLGATLTSLYFFQFTYFILWALSILVVLYIIKQNDKPAYKLTWSILILLLPLFGGLFYLLFRFQSSTRQFRQWQAEVAQSTAPLYAQAGCPVQPPPAFTNLGRYLADFACFPAYRNTASRYLTPGEDYFDSLMADLRAAKEFIFLEYFIINGGQMWNAILGVLKEKAAAGVEVRLLYDDMGCFLLLPSNYPQTLSRFGIRCRVFSPFRPVLSSLQNNRDHRKIAVIDGRVAYTGGINLADEYINAAERFGHWKDAGIRLEGEATRSFTLMFLEMWSLTGGDSEDYTPYLVGELPPVPEASGQVQPYCDSPLDRENVGEHVYLRIMSGAQRYLYINSPYLIVDDTMLSALTLAAKSGVDVRICTPQRWDKWLVHMTTRSYYRVLLRAGVRIYEYKNGFNHAKTFVADDRVATVGTTNLDFRSLYLHFECGCCLYDTDSVLQVKEDYLRTLAVSQQITLDDCKDNPVSRLFQEVLRVFAPLM